MSISQISRFGSITITLLLLTVVWFAYDHNRSNIELIESNISIASPSRVVLKQVDRLIADSALQFLHVVNSDPITGQEVLEILGQLSALQGVLVQDRAANRTGDALSPRQAETVISAFRSYLDEEENDPASDTTIALKTFVIKELAELRNSVSSAFRNVSANDATTPQLHQFSNFLGSAETAIERYFNRSTVNVTDALKPIERSLELLHKMRNEWADPQTHVAHSHSGHGVLEILNLERLSDAVIEPIKVYRAGLFIYSDSIEGSTDGTSLNEARQSAEAAMNAARRAVRKSSLELDKVFENYEATILERGRQNQFYFLLLGIAGVGAAAAVTFVIQRRITARLDIVTNGARQIRRGDLEYRIELPDNDGLGILAKEFNGMADELRKRDRTLSDQVAQTNKAHHDLRLLNIGLEDRIRARTKELQDSERRLRYLIENFSSGLYIHKDSKPIYANQSMLEMFGFSDLDELLALESSEEMLAPEERSRIQGYHEATQRGDPAPAEFDFWAQRTDGKKFFVNNRSFVVDWGGQKAICSTLFDHTERRAAEQSLAEQQHLMESLLANTHEGFWFIDGETRTTDLNPAMCRILGRKREDIIGKKIFEFVDEENKRVFDEQIALRKQGVAGAYEVALQRPDGSQVPCLNNATPLYALDGTRIGSVGIWADITEIRAVQRNLEQEKERAQVANVAKSEFLAVASHELRTPMNGVLGMANLLLNSDMADQQRKRVEVIKQSGENLLGLLNDILDISKIEAGRVEMERQHFDLRRVLDGVAALLQSRALEKGLEYETTVDDAVPDVVIGDFARLRQVLINIVQNAIKFTASGGVRISLTQTQTEGEMIRLLFEIADTGPGIDPAAQEKVFEKFTQADASTTRQFGGTGLGLAICRDFVTLMGGEIGIDSTLGEGAVFWFTIQCGIGHPDLIDGTKATDIANNAWPADYPSQLRILLAEDNPVNQEIARDTLEEAGHHVTIAANGLQACDAVQSATYDLILMDVHMPEMDGMTATQKIRSLPGDVSKIPIIALTADAMTGDRERFIAAGMDDYASKPIVANDLFATIGRNIKKAALPGGHDSTIEATEVH